MRIVLLVFVMGMIACGGDDDPPADESTCAETEWWCVEGASDPAADMTDEDKPGDDGKPDDEDKPDDTDGQAQWIGVLDPETGIGVISYYVTQENGEDCELSYAVTGATAVDDCTECEFAYELPMGELTVTTDAGGCGEAAALSGESSRYGQGPDIIYQVDGIDWYQLYTEKDASWLPVGASYMGDKDEVDGMWVFLIKY